MSSAFCCEDCGLLHGSEFTVLDAPCPDCGAPRSTQSIVTCVGCSMPLSLEEVLGGARHDCGPDRHDIGPGVQPTVGMWAVIGGSQPGRVSSVGDNTCYVLVSRRRVAAGLRRSGRFVRAGFRDMPMHAIRFVQKPPEKRR